jgi:hypothetical protein
VGLTLQKGPKIRESYKQDLHIYTKDPEKKKEKKKTLSSSLGPSLAQHEHENTTTREVMLPLGTNHLV